MSSPAPRSPHSRVSRSALRALQVRVRDLTTDDQTATETEVWAPLDEGSKRLQLIGAVAESHPSAKIRSYGNDAASFLDGNLLIVAHYGPVIRERVEAAPSQEALFQDVA